MARELDGDKWTLGKTKELTMELLWSWSKEYSLDDYGVSYLRLDKCIDFETEIYFKLGKSMLKKHRSVFRTTSNIFTMIF